MTNRLITNDLFSKVLIEPSEQADSLYIVSGYSSSAMAFHHAEKLREKNKNIFIHLIIGMAGKDGLSEANHKAFKQLMEHDLSNRFECSYLINHPPVHSKVYVWTKNSTAISGFTGSVNYSQQAFIGKNQREVATTCNPDNAYSYYKSLISDSLFCTHQDAEEVITLYQDDYRNNINSNQNTIESESAEYQIKSQGLQHITCSFINRSGRVSEKAGLNWGQRPNRERNQAYIQLPPHVYKSDFFPLRTIHFTVLTDDGKTLICTRAQKDEQGQAIETPDNNSRLGEYFRFRLGVANGDPITMQDLKKYGRTDVDFYKIDEENYYMDFSIHQ
jgi:hypothetical protein